MRRVNENPSLMLPPRNKHRNHSVSLASIPTLQQTTQAIRPAVCLISVLRQKHQAPLFLLERALRPLRHQQVCLGLPPLPLHLQPVCSGLRYLQPNSLPLGYRCSVTQRPDNSLRPPLHPPPNNKPTPLPHRREMPHTLAVYWRDRRRNRG